MFISKEALITRRLISDAISPRVNFYKTPSEPNESAIPPKLSVKADVADRLAQCAFMGRTTVWPG